MRVLARRTHLEWSGWTWTPFYKRAEFTWSADLSASHPGFDGELAGTFTQATVGLLPVSRRAFLE